MTTGFKKAFYISGIWLVPVFLVLIEGSLFLSRANWQSDYVPYFISFWVLRAVLAPAVVYYTLHFWVDHRKWFRLFATHVFGFLLFSVLFWSLAYLLRSEEHTSELQS